MLRTYRKLSIPLKLATAAFAVLIPLASLSFFMDVSFRYDINIGRIELTGTEALRDAFKIQHCLSNHWIAKKVGLLPASKTKELELEPDNPTKQINDVLEILISRQAKVSTQLDMPNEPDATVYGCVDLVRMQDAWKWYTDSGREVAYSEAYTASLKLITYFSNCAKLALDPALDSQMLARATVSLLPQGCAITSEMQQLALSFIQTLPANSMPVLTQKQRDELIGNAEFFKRGILKQMLDASHIALAEDANYYTYSPTLTLHYGALLEHYQKTANELLEVISRMAKGQAAATELFNAASRVRSAGNGLFASAMDEMDILIEKRIHGYQQWRMLGAGLSGSGLLIALLFLIGTSRSISRGIEAVVDYTRNVSGGNYDTEPSHEDLGPRLRDMVTDVDFMVTTLKDRINDLDNILHAMTVPCIVTDRSERITFINTPALDLVGRKGPAEAANGLTVAELVYGDPEKQTYTGQCMAENRSIRGELIDLVAEDGTVRHVRFDVAPLMDQHGVVTGAFSVITDLTEMIEKEKNIERLAAFPREAPDPVLSVTPDGNIYYINTAAQELFEASGLLSVESFLPEGHNEIVITCLASGNGRPGVESQVGDQSFSWTYHPLPDQSLVHMYATNITKRIRAESQLLHDAFHDTLTGLPNKALFLDRVNQAFRRARRRDIQFAVLFLDLDGFKNINDGLGHSVGDKLLARFAWRIKELLGPDETIARLGGDEFTILLPMVSDKQHALQVANRIQGDLKLPFQIDGIDLFVTASIGVINAPDGTTDASDLLRDAETAMYRAKSMGRARAEVFNKTMHKDATERIQLENDLKKGVERNEFEPYYQPIISLATGQIAGFEALIRWNHPTQGLVSPARFIPLAEETGLIIPMGAFMLEKACKQAKIWQDTFANHRDLTISVNMSVEQMRRPSIGEEIKILLKKTNLPPSTLKIEITESGLMNNVGRASALLKTFEDMGISLMIDDFGTGYSSLSHLHQFPFHFLKVDQSFVSSMEPETDNTEIVRTIISMAHTLGKRVVAEGVETEAQKVELTNLGCEFVQGYYFARPLPAAKAEALLEKNPQW